jgi:general secretion pathway protein B
MSYILDALKRADAERERGAVPGLHARQLGSLPSPSSKMARKRLWLAINSALALGALAVAVWLWPSASDKVPLAAVQNPVEKPLASAPLPAPTSTVPSNPATLAAASAPATPAPTQPAVTPVATSATAAPKAALPVVKASAAAVAVVVAPASVPLLSELPADFRQQIPALNISGVVYSDSPGQRLLLVNGLVVTQGALAAPELTLEEIRARSSIFSFRGTRFRLAH